MLSDICLSVAYIGPKARTERPRKTKIGTEVAHVTRDSDTTFNVKRSKVMVIRPLCSPPCWRIRWLQRWAWERVGRGKLLLHCHLLSGASAPTGEESTHGRGEGWGHIVAAACLQLVNNGLKCLLHSCLKVVYMTRNFVQLLKLGVIKPFIAKAMQPPSSEAVDHAIDTLFDLVSIVLNVHNKSMYK